jgi:hypothetical protein
VQTVPRLLLKRSKSINFQSPIATLQKFPSRTSRRSAVPIKTFLSHWTQKARSCVRVMPFVVRAPRHGPQPPVVPIGSHADVASLRTPCVADSDPMTRRFVRSTGDLVRVQACERGHLIQTQGAASVARQNQASSRVLFFFEKKGFPLLYLFKANFSSQHQTHSQVSLHHSSHEA